jgi:hypothetical protein
MAEVPETILRPGAKQVAGESQEAVRRLVGMMKRKVALSLGTLVAGLVLDGFAWTTKLADPIDD